MADTSAPRPGGDPLAAYCCACLAPPGEPCVGTTSNLPRERPHRLRPLAAAAHLTHCPDCEGSGWQATAPRLAPQVTCPVCGAEPVAPCTEGGAKRRDLHVVRRRAARAGLEPCGTCDAVGWVPAGGEPEPAAPRPLNAPAHGVHVIPGEVHEGVVPPSTSLTPPRPDVPDELIVRAAKASSVHFENCDDGETWQDCPDCRRAYDRAHYAVAAVVPEIARQARERVAAKTRRETAERVLLVSDITLGYRCPACHGKPAVHRWKDTGRRKRYVCGCGHQWDAPSRSVEWRTALDASPTALLRKVAEAGDLPEVPEKIARGES